MLAARRVEHVPAEDRGERVPVREPEDAERADHDVHVERVDVVAEPAGRAASFEDLRQAVERRDADLLAWRLNFGASFGASNAAGDADRDRDVDGADFLVWQRQLGNSSVPPAAQLTPEPASAVITLIAMIALRRRAR